MHVHVKKELYQAKCRYLNVKFAEWGSDQKAMYSTSNKQYGQNEKTILHEYTSTVELANMLASYFEDKLQKLVTDLLE